MSKRSSSILAVDFGSVNTRVVLIDLVNGAYRLVGRGVSPSTAGDPLRDVAVGFHRAAQDLAAQMRRPLLAEDSGGAFAGDDALYLIKPQAPDGTGVDLLVATTSAGRPLRAIVVGLMPDVSVASAVRALAGSFVEVVDTLSLADVRGREAQINTILAKRPDLVFIAGGTDAGAEAPILRLVDVVRDAVRMADHRPMVIYTGNRALQGIVREQLDEFAALFVGGNVRPSLLDERLAPAQMELAAAFTAYKADGGGGFDEINEISDIGILPTAQSYTNVLTYLGAMRARQDKDALGLLAVDVGSASAITAASVRGRTHVNVQAELGIGHSAGGVLARVPPGSLRRWLTWDATDAEIADYILNKTLRPASVPMNREELELEYALTREVIRLAVEEARQAWRVPKRSTFPPLSPIIGAGTVLANAPHSGVAALLLLDAIQPVGVTELWLDPAGLIPALGALAYVQPEAVVQSLDEGDLPMIGTAICAEGKTRIGRGGMRREGMRREGMRVKITLEDGQQIKQQVVGGALWTYPLPPGQTATVEVRLSGGLKVAGKSRLKRTVQGGMAGLIFDARGRPLPLLAKAEARALLYPRWLAGTKGVIPRRVDEAEAGALDAEALASDALKRAELAEEPVPGAADVPPDDDADSGGRRGLFRRRGKAAETPEAAAKPSRRRRGRRGQDDAPEEAPEPAAPPEAETDPEPQDEMSAMLDELRAESKKPQRGLFRR